MAVSWDKQWAWVGSLGCPRKSWCVRSCYAPLAHRPSLESRPKQPSALTSNHGLSALVHHSACPVRGSRDACHGCLRGLGWREWRVLTTGGPGHLVDPTRELFGIQGGCGASDSQKILGNRYPQRLGRAGWSSVNPSNAGWARRVRSLNCVFQARARRERKKPVVPIGPGTCGWGWGQV